MAMDKMLGPLVRRIRLALGRGIVRLVADGGGIQTVQLDLMANETRSKVERFQEYGFTSHPLEGAEAAVIFMGGNRDHGIVIAVDDRRYRLKALEAGEVAIYTDEGDKIHLKRGKIIEISTDELIVNAETRVTFNTPLVRASGDIIDNYEENENNMRGMREIYDIHTHPENDSGGPTDDPNEKMGV